MLTDVFIEIGQFNCLKATAIELMNDIRNHKAIQAGNGPSRRPL